MSVNVVDVCAFGYITKESEVFRGEIRSFTAGPPYFFSIALKRLGSSVVVVTKLAPRDEHILTPLRKLGIKVIVRKSASTSSFHTIYGKTLDERYIKVISVAEPFTLEDLLECINSKYIYIGPLTTNDFTIEFLKEARKHAPLILDVQGFTRRVRGDTIEYVDWDWKLEGMKFVDIFKADEKESRLLTGLNNIKESIKLLSEWGPKEVLITRSDGVYLYVKGKGLYFAPFKVSEIVGRVGRGDTCTAAYVHARLKGMSFSESIVFAAAATSLKLSYQGPLKNSEEEVQEFIERYYRNYEPKLASG